MTVIVAGTFDSKSSVDAAITTLRRAGFREDEFNSFFVGPPGRHDLYGAGGDAHHDEGTRHSGPGALIGLAIGAGGGLAVGLVAALLSPVSTIAALLAGLGIGAYVGALVGALKAARAWKETRATKEQPVEGPGGVMLAVNAERPGHPAMAVATLRRHGAHDIVQTQGEWKDGAWRDFDPRVPPAPIERQAVALSA